MTRSLDIATKIQYAKLSNALETMISLAQGDTSVITASA